MNLKEYIKQYIREILKEDELDEESSSGDVGAYATPKAFIKKKKKFHQYKESNYDKASQYGAASKYGAESDYTKASRSSDPSLYLGSGTETVSENMSKLEQIIKEELLNEVSYSKFKSEVKNRTKSDQLHKAIREVKRKLNEINRIVEYTSRMKQELSEGEDGIKYWKSTEKNIGAISEMVEQLNEKIKNLHK